MFAGRGPTLKEGGKRGRASGTNTAIAQRVGWLPALCEGGSAGAVLLVQVSQEAAAAFLILPSCKRAAAFLLQLIPHCIPAVPVPRAAPEVEAQPGSLQPHVTHSTPTPVEGIKTSISFISMARNNNIQSKVKKRWERGLTPGPGPARAGTHRVTKIRSYHSVWEHRTGYCTEPLSHVGRATNTPPPLPTRQPGSELHSNSAHVWGLAGRGTVCL